MADLSPITMARFAVLRPLVGERIAQLALAGDLAGGPASLLASREIGVEVAQERDARARAESQLAEVRAANEEERSLQTARIDDLEIQINALERRRDELSERLEAEAPQRQAFAMLALAFRKAEWDDAAWAGRIASTHAAVTGDDPAHAMSHLLSGLGDGAGEVEILINLAPDDTPTGRRLKADIDAMREQASAVIAKVIDRARKRIDRDRAETISEHLTIVLPPFDPEIAGTAGDEAPQPASDRSAGPLPKKTTPKSRRKGKS